MTRIFQKKWLALAAPAALAMLLGLSPPAATPAQAVTVTVGSASGQVGDTVEVPIVISDIGLETIHSFELDLRWTYYYGTCVGINSSGTLTSAWVTNFQPESGGAVIVGAGAAQLSGNGVLIKIQIELGPNSGSPAIYLDAALFNEGSPTATLVNGSLTITAIPTTNVYPDVGLMAVGDSLQFSTSGGTAPFTYTSSNPAVADFSGGSWLYALAPGLVQVYSEDANTIRDTTTGDIEIRAFKLSVDPVAGNTGDILLVPILLVDPSGYGIVSAEFTATWSAGAATFMGIETAGTLLGAAGWTSPFYSDGPGIVTMAAAGVTPLSGSGVLVYLRFQVHSSFYLYPSPGIFNETFPALPFYGYISVTPGPTIGITPGTASMLIGDLLNLNVTGSPTHPVTWSSDDPLTAYFLSPGQLLAVEEGVVHATVTDDNGLSATTGDIQICSLGLPALFSSIEASETELIPVTVHRSLDDLDIYSLEMEFYFNASYVTFNSVFTTGMLTHSWGTPTVVVDGNYVRIYMAGAVPLTGCGPLFLLQFTGDPGLGSPYTGVAHSQVLFNEGSPCAKLNTGSYCENLADVPEARETIKLWPNQPNPFNPATEIRFELAAAQHVVLQIHDPAGRLVRTLVDETRSAGVHRAVWNGLDRNGIQAGSGVYFYSLKGGAEHRFGKMVLLK